MADSGTDIELQTRSKEKVEFKWSEECYTPNDFVNNDSLPRVAKFEEDGLNLIPTGVKIFSKQALLLYTRVKQKHVLARTLYKEKGSTVYYEVGQTMTIPESYEGWFEMVPPDMSRAGFYKTLEEVAAIMPKRFLTRSPIKGVHVKKSADGKEEYMERKIPPGSILKVLDIFAAQWQTRAETGLLKKEKVEWTIDVKYLKCIDSDRVEVLLPFTERGRFNVLYERGGKGVHPLYRVSDILSDFTLPVKARLLYGKAPVVPCIFTGLMVFNKHEPHDTLIASTITNQRNVLLELPVKTQCMVQLVTNEDSYADLSSYQDGKKLCKKYAMAYASMIKLSPELDTDLSMVEHRPVTKSKAADDSLRTLDLITHLRLGEEPRDYLMESDSDTASAGSASASRQPENVMELARMSMAASPDSKC